MPPPSSAPFGASGTSGPLDVLAIFAHPDDAELLAGGSLARSVDRGARVGILDLTRGEKGTHGNAETREREAKEAAKVLGIALRRNADFPDAGIEVTDAARRRLAGIIRELRPSVVVTHWREGRHPDHPAAARLVVEASFLAGLKKLDCPGEAFRPRKVVHATIYHEDAPHPSFVIDVTEQVDRKLRALECYATQFQGATGRGEVFPGGERPIADQVRAHLAYWGSRIRRPYGEPFWTRETLAVDAFAALDVPTF
ncbi:MAG: bacillithiol biosynthesis deacetylase BshB1 [Gemmatimonadetes bacterium]|nr:bacillithiol biosynthesis deacetylase BshB1 [Gemmatimonadota bacterium]